MLNLDRYNDVIRLVGSYRKTMYLYIYDCSTDESATNAADLLGCNPKAKKEWTWAVALDRDCRPVEVIIDPDHNEVTVNHNGMAYKPVNPISVTEDLSREDGIDLEVEDDYGDSHFIHLWKIIASTAVVNGLPKIDIFSFDLQLYSMIMCILNGHSNTLEYLKGLKDNGEKA